MRWKKIKKTSKNKLKQAPQYFFKIYTNIQRKQDENKKKNTEKYTHKHTNILVEMFKWITID